VTQEFHISVTPIGGNDYLVRTERVAPGVPLAEEQVRWAVDEWLEQAARLMHDPLLGLLRGDGMTPLNNGLGSANPLDDLASNNLVALGQQLYNALFQGTIRDSWMTAQGIAKHRHEVLRLRLGLKDRRLPRLPWEVMHSGDPRQRDRQVNRPLATGTDVVFCRYYSGFTSLTPTSPLLAPHQPDAQLKILMVLAAPSDQDALALKQEALHLQEELQRAVRSGEQRRPFSDIQMTLLEQPGREELAQTLEHNHYHVLHYAGHSNPGRAGGSLCLVSRRTGLTETLNGDDLAGLLVNNGIRLAVFNSCRGVYTATTDSTEDNGDGNLAEALVRRGIPAVLAMAERIPDDVALNLSRLFYRNLKQSYPIDLSLNRARQGLLSSYGSHQLYWALPILYLHPEFDGFLQPQGISLLEQDGLESLGDGTEPDQPLRLAIGHHPEVPLEDEVNLWDAEFDLDPDDLEFEDPDAVRDDSAVARLVQQLSQNGQSYPPEDRLLKATPEETLLPDLDGNDPTEQFLPGTLSVYPVAPNPTAPVQPVAGHFSANRRIGVTATSDDVEVYSELEQLLAETGKLTDAIAACNQAIQINPNNAEAYHHLGWTLHQQGYLAEAIAAYQQAIRINPLLAEVHTHLGQAFYQKGCLTDAIQSYQRALQLKPSLREAQESLDLALQRQSVMTGSPVPNDTEQLQQAGTAPSGKLLPYPELSLISQPASPPRPWVSRLPLGLGAGALGISLIIAGGWWLSSWERPLVFLHPSPIASSDGSTDLEKASTRVVAALASDHLKRGDIPAAARAINALLEPNRNALSQASAVLTPSMSRYPEDPTLNFLMGRITWQFLKTGSRDYSIDDVRRYWQLAATRQPTPEHLNALGFAYYAEGKFNLAYRVWRRTLRLTGDEDATVSSGKPISHASLTAYAGLALASFKLSSNQPPSRRAELVVEVINLRQKVMTEDPVQFQPDALGQNWLWTEGAIADWRKIQTLQ